MFLQYKIEYYIGETPAHDKIRTLDKHLFEKGVWLEHRVLFSYYHRIV